jgi:hypothetical protein
LAAPAASSTSIAWRELVRKNPDHQRNFGAREARRGVSHILHQRVEVARARRIRAHDSGEAVEARAASQFRILDRTLDALAELARSLGQARDAAVSLLRIARRNVVQHDFHTGGAGALGDRGRRPCVRKLVLDVAKPGARGRGEAIEKFHLRKEQRQVRGELGHGASIA